MQLMIMNNNNDKFLSVEQLQYKRKLSQLFPEYGRAKLNFPIENNEESETVLQNYLVERHNCLAEGKCVRLGHLLRGEFIPEENAVKISKIKGKGYQHLGYNSKHQGKLLYPEEALYLMDCKKLEVYHKGISLSMQEACSMFIKGAKHQDEFLVYLHLTIMGYIVIRHKQRLFVQRTDSIANQSEDILEVDKAKPDETQKAKECLVNVFDRYECVNASRKAFSNYDRGPCLLMRHPEIHFPDAIRENNLQLPPLDPTLLPPGIIVSSQINDESPVRKRCRLSENLLFSDNDITSWYRYKEASQVKKKLKSDHNYLVTGNCRPIVDCDTATSTVNVLEKLKSCIRPSTLKSQPSFTHSLTVDFDVYLPATLKSGSIKNQLPHHHLIIVNHRNPLPHPYQIQQLKDRLDNKLPIKFGVVDNGNVAFYSFNSIFLQPDVLPN